MRRWRRPVAVVGGALVALHALPALVAITLASSVRPRLADKEVRQWLVVWGAFTIPLLVWTSVTANFIEGGLLLLQGLLGLSAGIWLRPRRESARLGLLIGLCALAVCGSVLAIYSSRSLVAYDGAKVATRIGATGVYQTLSYDIVDPTQRLPAARRSWLLSGGDGIELRGRVRLADGASGDRSEAASTLLTLDWPNRTSSAQLRITPGPNWTPFRLQVQQAISDPFVILRVYTSPSTRIAVAGLQLAVIGGPPAKVPPPTRQSLQLQDPVTLAHVALAMAAALMVVVGGPGGVAVVAITMAMIGWVTGTRAVFVALALLLLVPLARRFTRRGLTMAAVAVVLLMLGALLVQQGRATALLGAVPRTEVWATALRALAMYPVTGLQGAGVEFAEFAAANGIERPVLHAHNFWLEFAGRYGVFGVIASLSLGIGLLFIAVRRGGLVGFIALTPLLVLNMVDATLLQGQVLVAVTLTINLLAEPSRDDVGPAARLSVADPQSSSWRSN